MSVRGDLVNGESAGLARFAANVYSATGEDGVIERILQILPERDGWCVEFGALDGRRGSNVRNLIESRDYSGVLIESDAQKYTALQKEIGGNPAVIALHVAVGWGGNDGLDALLRPLPIPIDFDFLSIDIDGNDYHVWEAVVTYRPKVVCIEFNQTIPNEVLFVQSRDSSVKQGASLASIVELGRRKKYELVCVISCNAFFVREEYYPLFGIEDNRPQVLRTNLNAITYMFLGYDGSLHLAGSREVHWHYGVRLRESRLQPLPRVFRMWPEQYGRFRRVLFSGYALLRAPEVLGVARQRGLRASLGAMLRRR